MNRTEFTDILRRHISEVGDPAFVNDTVSYYQDYIDTAIRKGRTEDDVLSELGDPRLIAKSIVASRDDAAQSGDYRETGQTYSDGGSQSSGYEEGYSARGSGIYDGKLHIFTKRGRDIALPLAAVKVAGIILAVLLIYGVSYITWQLMPVICVAILAVLIYRFFKENF